MQDAIDIGSCLTAEDLRRINVHQWELGPASYFGRTSAWHRPEHEVLPRVPQLGSE